MTRVRLGNVGRLGSEQTHWGSWSISCVLTDKHEHVGDGKG